VPFYVGVTYTSGEGLHHGNYVNIYLLSLIKYRRLITVPSIVDLLWAMILWIVGLMADGLLHPLHRPIGLVRSRQSREAESDEKLRWVKEQIAVL
jgi:hypothetical protein